MTAVCPNCGLRHREAGEGDYASELDNIRLSSHKRKILSSVAKQRGRLISVSRIADDIYSDREDGGPLAAVQTIRVMIHHLNKVIASRGWVVENEHGHGYRLVRFEA